MLPGHHLCLAMNNQHNFFASSHDFVDNRGRLAKINGKFIYLTHNILKIASNRRFVYLSLYKDAAFLEDRPKDPVEDNVFFGLLKPGYIETRLEKRMLSAKSKLLYGRNISKCMFLAVRGGETPCFEIKWVSIIQKYVTRL